MTQKITIDNVDKYFRMASKDQAEKIFKMPKQFPFKFIVSIIDPPERRRDPMILSSSREPKGMYEFYRVTKSGPLRIEVHDVERKEYEKYGLCPTKNNIRQIIGYAKSIKSPCLFHCTNGVSMSASACIMSMASLFGAGKEEKIMEKTLQIRNDIIPNLLMLRYADEIFAEMGMPSELEKVAARRVCPQYKLTEKALRTIKMPKKIDLSHLPKKITV